MSRRKYGSIEKGVKTFSATEYTETFEKKLSTSVVKSFADHKVSHSRETCKRFKKYRAHANA
jgi:hypothetical protein